VARILLRFAAWSLNDQVKGRIMQGACTKEDVMEGRKMGKLFAPVLGLVLIAVTGANDKADCAFGGGGDPAVECTVAADCAGQVNTSQCGGAWECVAGQCEWQCNVECAADTDCKDGFQCLKGQCVASVTCVQSGCSGEVCAAEAVYTDCMVKDWFKCLPLTKCGQFAADGSCGFEQNEAFVKCMAGGGCWSDADCPDGYQCLLADCGIGMDCAGKGVCEKKPDPSCQSDADCQPGQYCRQEAVCPPCVSDPVNPCKVACQVKGTCEPLPTGCMSDAECPEGYYCEFNGAYCGGAEKPDPSDPSGAPMYCGGTCVAKPVQCYSDADCPKGQVCYLTPCGPCDCKPDDPTCACPACLVAMPGYCGPAGCIDNDGDGWCQEKDCNDWDASIFPYAAELCDGLDNDCNGIVDDGCTQPTQCYTDADCGYGYSCILPPAYDAAGVMACCPYNAKCTAEIPPCGAGYCMLADGFCWTDKDCKAGYACQNMMNCAPDMNCIGPYQCLPVTTYCATDKECPAGFHCAAPGTDKCCSGAYCDSAWPMCGTCVPDAVPGDCTSDADCGAGFVCDFSMVDPTTCCLPGQVCLAIYMPCMGWCKEQPPACVASKPGSHGECKMLLGYIFDGTSCVLEGGCGCKKGVECWDSQKECEAACSVAPACVFDSDCGLGEYCDHSPWAEMVGCCVPLDASGAGCPAGYPVCPGTCKLQPGLCWSDADCAAGTHCEGAIVCPPGAMCFVADQPGKCLPDATCTIVKPGSHGMCEMFMGYIFDGTACVGESGCGCGAECAFFFKTLADCEAACPVKPLTCNTDDECGIGQYCQVLCGNGWCSGQCSAVPSGTCVKDADCGAGGTCQKDVCPMCVGCPCFGKCVNSGPLPCTADKDCPAGQACEQFTQCPACYYMDPPCLAPCLSTQVCLPPCWADADCPSGFYCYVTKCDPASGEKCIGPYECQPLPVG
jgi:Cys-rich repeat protein